MISENLRYEVSSTMWRLHPKERISKEEKLHYILKIITQITNETEEFGNIDVLKKFSDKELYTLLNKVSMAHVSGDD